MVRAAEQATGSAAFREVLQDFAWLLETDRVLAGLSLPDGRLVAAVISHDAVTVDDGSTSLRRRAAAVAASSDRMAWVYRGPRLTLSPPPLRSWPTDETPP